MLISREGNLAYNSHVSAQNLPKPSRCDKEIDDSLGHLHRLPKRSDNPRRCARN